MGLYRPFAASLAVLVSLALAHNNNLRSDAALDPVAATEQQTSVGGSGEGVRRYSYTIVAEYPHDPAASTQGLVFSNGWLYESIGEYGGSGLRRTRLETGEVLQKVAISPKYFGMGLAILADELIQATGREKTALIYGANDLRLRRELPIPARAWGIASDGRGLAMSDGTAVVRFLNTRTFVEERQVTVRDGQEPVKGLNELEYVAGELYANVFRTDTIVRINPASGLVTGRIDLKGLLAGFGGDSDAILNGIAYDAARRRLFVTGRLWPKLFEIRLRPTS